jgi:hypothetical protein
LFAGISFKDADPLVELQARHGDRVFTDIRIFFPKSIDIVAPACYSSTVSFPFQRRFREETHRPHVSIEVELNGWQGDLPKLVFA